MLEITPYSTSTSAALPSYRASEGPKLPRAATEAPVGDRVELSAAALDSSPRSEENASAQRISDIRAQIAADTYLTDEKLNAVVDRLHEELFGNPPAPQA